MSENSTFLYVPADRPELLAKARRHQRAALILDLEDSVAPAQKDRALENVIAFATQEPHAGGTWVRINQGERGIREASFLGAIENLTGLWIPKAEEADHVRHVVNALGRGPSSLLRVGLLIESAKGLLALNELAAMTEVSQLQLGEVDLGADLRQRSQRPENMLLARQSLVVHAAANGLPAPVAPVDDNTVDMEGFRESSKKLRDAGFGGRACIHPAQLEIALEVFSVSEEERRLARNLLACYNAARASGHGVIRDENGVMIDAASVRSARLVLGLGA